MSGQHRFIRDESESYPSHPSHIRVISEPSMPADPDGCAVAAGRRPSPPCGQQVPPLHAGDPAPAASTCRSNPPPLLHPPPLTFSWRARDGPPGPAAADQVSRHCRRRRVRTGARRAAAAAVMGGGHTPCIRPGLVPAGPSRRAGDGTIMKLLDHSRVSDLSRPATRLSVCVCVCVCISLSETLSLLSLPLSLFLSVSVSVCICRSVSSLCLSLSLPPSLPPSLSENRI
jgi:hypothetical protein